MKGFVIFFLDFRYNFPNIKLISKSFDTFGCCHPCYPSLCMSVRLFVGKLFLLFVCLFPWVFFYFCILVLRFVCQFIRHYVCPSVCLSVCLSVYLSVICRLLVCYSCCLSVCLFFIPISLYTNLSICILFLSIFMSITLSLCYFLHLIYCLFVIISVYYLLMYLFDKLNVAQDLSNSRTDRAESIILILLQVFIFLSRLKPL